MSVGAGALRAARTMFSTSRAPCFRFSYSFWPSVRTVDVLSALLIATSRELELVQGLRFTVRVRYVAGQGCRPASRGIRVDVTSS